MSAIKRKKGRPTLSKESANPPFFAQFRLINSDLTADDYSMALSSIKASTNGSTLNSRKSSAFSPIPT